MNIPARRFFHLAHLAGLIVTGALIGLILFVAFDLARHRPDLGPIIRLGFETEIAASLLFLPTFLLEDAVKAKKLILDEFVRFRISGGLRALSVILAILGAACFFAQKEIILTSMMLAFHAATLLALVCAYGLISNFIAHLSTKNHPAD